MTGPRVSERWTPLPGCNCGCWETFPAEASAVPEGLRDVERVLDWAEAAAAPGSVLRQQVIAARAALAATPAKAEGLDTGNECLAVIEPDEAIHFCLLPEGHSGEHRTALKLDEDREAARVARDAAWTPLRQDATPAKAEGLSSPDWAWVLHDIGLNCQPDLTGDCLPGHRDDAERLVARRNQEADTPAKAEGLRTLADLRGFLVEHLPDGQGVILHLFDDAVRSHAMAMRTPAKAEGLDATDALEAAWGIIANAGGGDWTKEAPEWQEAAARWRDTVMPALAARLRADTATEGEDR